MYTPKPPCFLVPCCNDIFEKSLFCKNVGKLGVDWFDKHRTAFMMTATFVTFVCMILSIVALFAVSTANDDVKATCWTYGKVENGAEIFVGLNALVLVSANGTTVSAVWGESTCTVMESVLGDDSSFCVQCRDSCDASVTVAIMSLVTILPTITTDIQRSTRKGDMNCQKFMGMLTGILSFVSTLAALSSYAGGCLRNLPTQIGGLSIQYSPGPGLLCLVVATVLKVVDIVVHVCTPVLPYRGEIDDEGTCSCVPRSLDVVPQDQCHLQLSEVSGRQKKENNTNSDAELV